ncbi:FMN-dependent dehydrogenase/cytochrome heme-binding domain [Yamadazyma tenuis]|uniref:L-lactate dehydrogenase (cytochrome) n=1 Tax=Candida tenuis (strain ATCC 10573 / BCRC 21748 / CBS 615 / JCM 9827 / NBRC 10315 / NRRL Y-1498 / VKM Y-70) TaxID=590646 RepID=G3B5P8_CANTC|nr:cytochrome b2, mitochondrial precursor [Yamadazyma tenuis ATCC 10573]EGV63279.1 cytochrome b2, mitochondrial precursor [Yamadazyma tenuis ATCC 10573]WEJ96905.1 FMN-dependent dehydrogenase/cytochrome heme-binding domain [Yamadazyma tenuis]
MSVSIEEVRKHNSKADCWVIIHNKVYDVTDFLSEHPGGSGIILKYAGKDATKAFDPIHPSDTLTKYLPGSCFKGEVDPDSIKKLKQKTSTSKKTPQATKEATKATQATQATPVVSADESTVDEFDVEYDEQDNKRPMNFPIPANLAANEDEDGEYDDDEDDPPDAYELNRRKYAKAKPDISQIYNLNDFEFVARHTMEKTAWAYYSSGCDDEITLRENHSAYHHYFFNPRVLVDVSAIDISTTMLNDNVSAPFYITATALGRLGHPDGEKVLTRSAAKQDIIQMIPTLASCSFDEIIDEATDKQIQWFQLYVNSDREICKSIVQHAEARGIKGIFITVDAPQLGRREKDMRSKNFEDLSHVQDTDDDSIDRSQGAARAISSFIDTSLNWEDIKWFRSITKLPIILKGIQTVGDSLKAIDYGVDGIVLSNHGGRQLEFSRPPIDVLAELHYILKAKKLENKLEIYIDGGIRRATDILKALCLGAKGVGIGRPFLYAMSTYGDDGVYKAIQILKDEMIMNMRLLGVSRIEDLNDSFIDTRFQNRSMPNDRLFESVYEPLESPPFKL